MSAEVSKERSHVTFAPKDADQIVSQPLVVCSGCRDTGCMCVWSQAAWEMLRKEKGRDALNRFLATWEKLHSVADATPIPQKTTPTRQPKDKKENHKVPIGSSDFVNI